MENAGFKNYEESNNQKSVISDTSGESGIYSIKANSSVLQADTSPDITAKAAVIDKEQGFQQSKEISHPHTKTFYWTNFIGVSVSILCVLTAMNSLFFIQSSLHSKGGLGSLALAVDYGAQMIACLFVPTFLMKKIGYKWTLVLAMIGVGSYMGANMRATFETLMPTAIFMAVGFASMWATMNCLLCDLAKGYARLTDTDPAVVISRFLGVFYTIIETGKIWGSLISSLTLQPGGDNRGISAQQLTFCGASYCNQKLGVRESNTDQGNSTSGAVWHNSTSDHGGVTETQIITLCSISLGICGLGILVVLAAVDSRKSSNDTSRLLTHIMSTIRMLSNRNLQLLIVITICAGLVQSFYASDFTKSFLTCSLGIHEVGFVSTCYGLVVVLGSLFMGCIAQFVGRQFLLLLASALNIADLLMMLLWVPDPKTVIIFYIIAGVWAISTSIWLTILTGLYGEVFATQHEEAFSNHRLCECIGFVIGFVWSPLLCMTQKIYGTICLIVIGVVRYVALEFKLRRI